MKLILIFLACLTAPQLVAAEVNLSAEDKRTILQTSLDKIHEIYVDESKRQPIVDAIKQIDAESPYDQLETSDFIERLTQDLREVSGDGHLYLRPSKGGKGRRRMLPGDAGDYLDVEMLEGNVGYLNVRIFGMNDTSIREIDEAMALVKDSDALIIDLRHCRGGAVTGVEHLLNYLARERVHYLTSVNSYQGWTHERVTQPDQSKFDYVQPVYVLIGDKTFSAGEDFAYAIQLLDIGPLVGQSTKGGGYMNMMFPVHESLALSVSIGKTYGPKTGKGWQGTGIQTDISVPEQAALDHVLSIIADT